MSAARRLAFGTSSGAVLAGMTYVVLATPPWWWFAGLAVACLIWFGALVAVTLFD